MASEGNPRVFERGRLFSRRKRWARDVFQGEAQFKTGPREEGLAPGLRFVGLAR